MMTFLFWLPTQVMTAAPQHFQVDILPVDDGTPRIVTNLGLQWLEYMDGKVRPFHLPHSHEPTWAMSLFVTMWGKKSSLTHVYPSLRELIFPRLASSMSLVRIMYLRCSYGMTPKIQKLKQDRSLFFLSHMRWR